MTTEFQQSLSYFENLPEVYEPTDEEKAQGDWAVVFEKRDASGEPDCSSRAHIIPTFGTNHQIAAECWCGPTVAEKGTQTQVRHEPSQ